MLAFAFLLAAAPAVPAAAPVPPTSVYVTAGGVSAPNAGETIQQSPASLPR